MSVVTEGNSDLWIYDRLRETFFRLTSSAGEEQHPLFAPNSLEIAYTYSMAGPFRMFSRPADGAGEPRELGGHGGSESPESFSADGKLLVFSEQSFESGFDLSILDASDSSRRALLATPFDERSARISPDGRFVAYSSNESGRFEVYATPFPEVGARLQVSVAGGEHPRWTRGGQELVFLSSDAWKALWFATPGGGEEFGLSIGTLVLAANVLLLGAYTFGCHSLRHLVGGGIDRLARRPVRRTAYQCVSWCNKRHMRFAWFSLVWVAFADLYVRLCAMGVWTDLRLF